jgi:hypothetical protein
MKSQRIVPWFQQDCSTNSTGLLNDFINSLTNLSKFLTICSKTVWEGAWPEEEVPQKKHAPTWSWLKNWSGERNTLRMLQYLDISEPALWAEGFWGNKMTVLSRFWKFGEDWSLEVLFEDSWACGQFRNLLLRQNHANIRINDDLVSVFSGSANFLNKDYISKFMIFMSYCLICFCFFVSHQNIHSP